MTDAVNHPAHYGGEDNPYEVIKVIEAWNLSFHIGNAVKYIGRPGKGNYLEDLKKARWYLNREIANLEGADTVSLTDFYQCAQPNPDNSYAYIPVPGESSPPDRALLVVNAATAISSWREFNTSEYWLNHPSRKRVRPRLCWLIWKLPGDEYRKLPGDIQRKVAQWLAGLSNG
jgi:hypothetical protein